MKEVSNQASEKSFLWGDFYNPEKDRYFSFEKLEDLSLDETQKRLQSYAQEKPQFLWQEPNKKDFETEFFAIQTAIEKGLYEKAVPYVRAAAPWNMPKTEIAYLLTELLKAPTSLFLYALWYEDEAVFGLTPELLARWDFAANTLTTMALAGTKLTTDGNDLLKDPKERKEHQLVVDPIRGALSRLGRVSVGETQIMHLPTLDHLFTPISVELDTQVTANEILLSLHPTPALGTFPKSGGLAFLKQIDPYPERYSFGAPFGYFESPEKAEVVVAIRNIEAHKGEVFLASGCGIVKESQIAKEWQELKNKRASVLKLLNV